MIYTKATVLWGHTIYTRKDRRAHKIDVHGYAAHFHYNRRARLKPIRKDANRSLRRYKGDVSDHGWYKKYSDVMWTAF